MPASIESIREDLERCRAGKNLSKVFGAESHQFKLNPVVRKSVVANFEKKHQVLLPDEYRRFITEIGNGGAGPYYGLFKFREMDDCFSFQRWKENDGFVGDLSEPFPHKKPWNGLPDYPEEDEFDDEDLYEAEIERLDRIYWNPENVNGAFPICHHGCAARSWLIVTGPEAGNVWDDFRADDEGLTPATVKRKRRTTFLEWYDHWLQQAVAKLGRARKQKSNQRS